MRIQGLNQAHISPRIEPTLSLRNVRTLTVSAHLLRNLILSDDSLDNMDAFESPLQLETFTILLHFEKDEERNRLVGDPIFESNLAFLSFLNPSSLHLRDPFSFLPLKDDGDLYVLPLKGWSLPFSHRASSIIACWTRLEELHLHDVDLHYTQNDRRTRVVSECSFFLDFDSSDDRLDGVRPLSVWWYVPEFAETPLIKENSEPLRTSWAMREPVRLLLSRGDSSNPRIERAFIVISDETKRQQQEDLLQDLSPEQRGPFQIISSSEVAASLGR